VDLGVGTHSGCEIAFDLPPQAKEFTTLVGLDRHMGPGACATCKIYPDQAADRPLFASGFLRGGQEPTPVGPLSVAGCRRLVLVTQWAGESRPQGAYPLDIGGHVDWLMPFVTVDADDASYCRSLRRFVPGWNQWDLTSADARRVRVVPTWDAVRECWLPVLFAAGARPLTLERKLPAVSSTNDLVELIFAQPGNASLPEIELRVDGALAPAARQPEDNNRVELGPLPGQPARARAAAPRARARPTPSGSLTKTASQYQSRTMQWDLKRYHGRAVQLTLSLVLDKQVEGLAWRELTTMPAIGNSAPRALGRPQE
jgi:hypothetical protein